MDGYRGKNMGGHKKTPNYKLRKEVSKQINLTNTLNLSFQLPEIWENKFILVKPLSLWYLLQQPQQNNTDTYPKTQPFHSSGFT